MGHTLYQAGSENVNDFTLFPCNPVFNPCRQNPMQRTGRHALICNETAVSFDSIGYQTNQMSSRELFD